MNDPDSGAILRTVAEFDQIGRAAFMEKYGFADLNITYNVLLEDKLYPCKAIFGAAFGKMPGGVARDSTTCRGDDAHKHLKSLGFDLLAETPSEAREHAFQLFDAAGNAFHLARFVNKDSGGTSYRVKTLGGSTEKKDAQEVESLVDAARAVIVEGRLARLRAADGSGAVSYIGYGKRLIVRYELDAKVAAQLGVPPSGAVSTGSKVEKNSNPQKVEVAMSTPHNLILYGPPGTGKTYETAAEAVRLCGETPPTDRENLMQAYRRLCAAGRIEFVTFHPSVSYESFVEGLRPQMSKAHKTAGFDLVAEPGIFRKIARRAETSTGAGGHDLEIGERRVFKMSIGTAAQSEEAYLFDEAVANGYTLLGYEDIDWTGPQFTTIDAFLQTVQRHDPNSGKKITGHSGSVKAPFAFRSAMKVHDLIIVSKGNRQFRAIGEVTGEYEYVRRDNGAYCHRRRVRWLWTDRAGVPVSEVYARNFMQQAVYLLDRNELNVPALERYVNSQQGGSGSSPEPFVLIIDEINRADISKVFGELITLLEADKRLGATNELKVRLPYSNDTFGVPSNLHILGTMNSADRSIALLDTALRRRFTFREVMPNPGLLKNPIDGIDLKVVLSTINGRIEYMFDRDHVIGHAAFMKCANRRDVDGVMRETVIPLLAEYFYEDWSKVAAVLGDPTGTSSKHEGYFLDCQRLDAPKGLSAENGSAPKYRWTIRREFSYDGFKQ